MRCAFWFGESPKRTSMLFYTKKNCRMAGSGVPKTTLPFDVSELPVFSCHTAASLNDAICTSQIQSYEHAQNT